MDLKNKSFIWLISCFVIILVLLGYIFYLNSNLSHYKSKAAELEVKFNDLSENLQTLNQNYDSLNEDYSDLEQSNEIIKSEVDKVITRIDDYKSEIQTSMEWFRTNSELPEKINKKSVKMHLDSHCINDILPK